MAMRFQYDTPVICMAMAPSERRECVMTSSGANESLAATTLIVSVRRTAMMYEALAERSPRAAGYSLTGVSPERPC